MTQDAYVYVQGATIRKVSAEIATRNVVEGVWYCCDAKHTFDEELFEDKRHVYVYHKA